MKIPITILVAFLVMMAFSSPLVQGEKLDDHNSLVFTLRGIKAETSTIVHGTTTPRTDETTNKENNSAQKSLTSQMNDVAPLHGTQASRFTGFSNDQGSGSTGIDNFRHHYDPCSPFNYNHGCSSP